MCVDLRKSQRSARAASLLGYVHLSVVLSVDLLSLVGLCLAVPLIDITGPTYLRHRRPRAGFITRVTAGASADRLVGRGSCQPARTDDAAPASLARGRRVCDDRRA